MNFEALIPIFGMLTGTVMTGAVVWGIVQIVRIRTHGSQSTPELAGEVAALRDQVDSLQQQLLETQERIDFTERLLTRGRGDREEH
jgi:hypothetical protein